MWWSKVGSSQKIIDQIYPSPKWCKLWANIKLVLCVYVMVLECLMNRNIGLKKVLFSNRVISITVRKTEPKQIHKEIISKGLNLCSANWALLPPWILQNTYQRPYPYEERSITVIKGWSDSLKQRNSSRVPQFSGKWSPHWELIFH